MIQVFLNNGVQKVHMQMSWAFPQHSFLIETIQTLNVPNFTSFSKAEKHFPELLI